MNSAKCSTRTVRSVVSGTRPAFLAGAAIIAVAAAGGCSGGSSSNGATNGSSGAGTGGAAAGANGASTGGTSSSSGGTTASSSGPTTSSGGVSGSSGGTNASSGGGPSTSSGGASSGGTSASSGSGGGGGMAGGSGVAGGSSGASGGTSGAPAGSGVCDIFASGNTPCVAAHSTVRALFGAYKGNLYQVTRASDNMTKDIGVLAAGGVADGAAQDAFCAGTTCTISIIYDQSSQGNHLTPGPAGQHGSGPDKPSNATDLKTTASGHEVYGVRIRVGMGYRNDKASGTATGDAAETEYMVSSQNDLVNSCCYDYGNAETNNRDDGNATMEAVYFGGGSGQATGVGPGPWVEVDIENGLCAGVGANGGKEAKGITTNMSLPYDYVTAVVVGRTGAAPGSFALYGSDATAGTLKTMYDGPRPNGFAPMKKQGAIILGIGGDNTNSAAGDFYEGVMTTGAATLATLDAVQANIVAAGYGK
jgi:non-reducing end alpha-L-arabinofuranosidase